MIDTREKWLGPTGDGLLCHPAIFCASCQLIIRKEDLGMNIRNSVIRSFKAQFGKDPDYVVKAPGRVNLLGEHVDYNNGLVLPIAIDRATWLAFSPSGSEENHLIAKDLRQSCKFTSRSVKRNLPVTESHFPAGLFIRLASVGQPKSVV